jgi:hydrogenase expression/formation protein HypE
MPEQTHDDSSPAAWPACPTPQDTQGVIEIAHGGGGRRTQQLIASIFRKAFGDPLQTHGHDGAVFNADAQQLAITTDSYVVQPLEFPGGDIGSMSVHGTINDLLMCGARPRYLSAAFVLEVGLEIATLERITASMRAAANESGVDIVTGDTKVIGHGRGDGLFINTSGVGSVICTDPIGPSQVTPGSAVIVSGDVGRHGVAVMAAREKLDLGDAIVSDSAALGPAVLPLLESGLPIQCLRDLTRGGLATALVEIAQTTGLNIDLTQQDIPIGEAVRGACELLGLDPIYVANEGRFIAILPQEHAQKAVSLLRDTAIARNAQVIGRVTEGTGRVCMQTPIGTRRVVEMISGEQLPRIC